MNYLFLDFTAWFFRTLLRISVSKVRKFVTKSVQTRNIVKSNVNIPKSCCSWYYLNICYMNHHDFGYYPYEQGFFLLDVDDLVQDHVVCNWLFQIILWMLICMFLFQKHCFFLIGHLTIQFLYSFQHFIFRPELYSEELPLQHKSAAL